MDKRIEHNLLWIFEAITREIDLPFSFDEKVTIKSVDLENLRSKEIFMNELSNTEQNGWKHHIGEYVCISATQICDHAIAGEEDNDLGQLQENAYAALRLVYPASFMGTTTIRCEGWIMYRDLETDELTKCYKQKEDDGFDYWSIGYNGFHAHQLKFFPDDGVLHQKHLEDAKAIYQEWIPDCWFSKHVNLRIATNHLHFALKQDSVFARYMGCFVALESLFSSYEEFLSNYPKQLFEKIVVPRMKNLISDKLPEGLISDDDLNEIYTWRGVLAHRGTASFIKREDTENSLKPDRESMDRMVGIVEILARQSIVTGWLDYPRYEKCVLEEMS